MLKRERSKPLAFESLHIPLLALFGLKGGSCSVVADVLAVICVHS